VRVGSTQRVRPRTANSKEMCHQQSVSGSARWGVYRLWIATDGAHSGANRDLQYKAPAAKMHTRSTQVRLRPTHTRRARAYTRRRRDHTTTIPIVAWCQPSYIGMLQRGKQPLSAESLRAQSGSCSRPVTAAADRSAASWSATQASSVKQARRNTASR
jgi:hypothetical protein